MRDIDKTHFALDIETLGTGPNSVILSIGCAAFKPLEYEVTNVFYQNVSLDSAMRYGRVDAPTLLWWMSDDQQAARNHLFKNEVDLPEALEGLKEFTLSNAWGDISAVWGNGSAFDCVILEQAFAAANIECPWKFWAQRGLRTLKALCPQDTIWAKPAIPHHAGHDAAAQAHQVQQGYALLAKPAV